MKSIGHEFDITHLKWIVLKNSFGQVYGEKLSNIISTVPKRHLREIIGPKREKFCFLRDLSKSIK